MLREHKEELLKLWQEKRLGNFERRRRRMIAAQNRLEQRGLNLSGIFALANDPERLSASEPEVRRDVFAVLNIGFASAVEMDEAWQRQCLAANSSEMPNPLKDGL